jgi:Arc/MetJ-type ribon-helix-helix transcriptional regulator
MSNKNDDEIKLIIAGEDEYSGASEGVRDELSDLSKQAGKTRDELTKLDKSLELADTYQRQEQELNGLVSAQAKAQIAVRELNEANRASKGANEEVTESLVRAKAELSSLRT